ncbi:FBP domain-containing protein [Nocardioides hankookensis]|uniref:FBP domain-containing protein n=1 Tax=Nocardioides hankookensis TaxID=443157 RepID=A0ABW1LGX0_9ACTN
MEPLTETQIRAAFVNCSKGEAQRLNLPRDLADVAWDDLDYLGWRDPQAPARGYLVAEHDGRPLGLVLRAPGVGVGRRASMCSLCMTVRSGGVALMVAPRAGKAGQRGHSVGTPMCSDLACSAYVRGRASASSPVLQETLTTEQRIERLVANVEVFVGRVLREE